MDGLEDFISGKSTRKPSNDGVARMEISGVGQVTEPDTLESFIAGKNYPPKLADLQREAKERARKQQSNPSEPDLSKLPQEFTDRLDKARTAYKERYGEELPITSGARTAEEQKALIKRAQSGDKHVHMPAAVPEGAYVVHTNAVDISSKVPEKFLNEFGLHRPLGKKDPVHTVLMPNYKPKEKEQEVTPQATQAFPKTEPKKEPPKPVEKNVARTRAGTVVKEPNEAFTGAMGGLARTIGGAARGAVTAALGAPGDINQAIVNNIGSLFPNAPALPTTEKIQKALPLQPTTQEGKTAQILGEFLPISLADKTAVKTTQALEQVLPASVVGKASTTAPKVREALTEQFATKKAIPVAQRIEPTLGEPTAATAGRVEPTMGEARAANQPMMAGVGAAKADNAAILAEAKARATPELRADLDKIKPQDLNVDALNRVMEADQLPVPVRLTEGQATQDPIRISRERNERGIKEKFAHRFNEQNAALRENADLMKERVAPNIHTTSHVEDSERTIGLINNRIKADDAAINEAYQKLRESGAGKVQIDSKSFANNAMKALGEFDEHEFLPSSILSRLNAYKEGKEMNFNQFENLRTQLARETRKAQAANDGNAVHALTVVRSKLEELPLIGETAEAKQIADKARSLAKAQFDLLDKKRPTYNPLYADVMNGVSDTKDFVPKLVFRSDNKSFAKTMQSLKDNPEAMEHLRSGALDYMIRESTDASGNFMTGKFSKLVENLDLNKKLDQLFGEEAKGIRAIANTGKLIEARPRGAFVNESNTAVAAAQMAKQYASKVAQKTPILGAIVEPAAELLQARKAEKQVQKALKPAAGVRLSDIGKKGK